MTAKDILTELKSLGRESYKRVLVSNHGIKEPCFGVPIGELKKIQKRVGNDYKLAIELYRTGNYDAMYLAGLVADDSRMSPTDLQRWADKAYERVFYGHAVPSVAAGSPHGRTMALKWIESGKETVAAAGWATLSSLVSVKADAELDLEELKRLLQRVQKTIHQAPDRVRIQMNAFVIAVAIHVRPLAAFTLKLSENIGPVTADLGDNDCRIPFAPDSIRKVQERGAIGKKRKTAKC